jgi:hypothetical protein
MGTIQLLKPFVIFKKELKYIVALKTMSKGKLAGV